MLLHRLLAIRFFPQVVGDGVCFPPGLLDELGGYLCVFLFFGQVDEGDVCAFSGVQDGYGAADAAVGALITTVSMRLCWLLFCMVREVVLR